MRLNDHNNAPVLPATMHFKVHKILYGDRCRLAPKGSKVTDFPMTKYLQESDGFHHFESQGERSAVTLICFIAMKPEPPVSNYHKISVK